MTIRDLRELLVGLREDMQVYVANLDDQGIEMDEPNIYLQQIVNKQSHLTLSYYEVRNNEHEIQLWPRK